MTASISSVLRQDIPVFIKSNIKTILLSSIPVVGIKGYYSNLFPLMNLEDLSTYPEGVYRKKFTRLKAYSIGLLIQSIVLTICFRRLSEFFTSLSHEFFRHFRHEYRPVLFFGKFSFLALYIAGIWGFSIGSILRCIFHESLYNHFKAAPRGCIERVFKKGYLSKNNHDHILALYNKNKDILFLP